MFAVDYEPISKEFFRCYHAAGCHILAQVQGETNWIKGNSQPPFLEHLSFRLGNQLFFVRIEDVDGALEVPSSRNGLQLVADGNKGHACIMPMRRRATGWEPDEAGWGLLDARTGNAVDPVALVSDERIELTDWELQDLGVQVVAIELEKRGLKLASLHGYLGLDPAILFAGDAGLEWVVVRAVRFPQPMNCIPKNWQGIVERCARHGKVGYFASVGFANGEGAQDPTEPITTTPIWRGHRLRVRFDGLAIPTRGDPQ